MLISTPLLSDDTVAVISQLWLFKSTTYCACMGRACVSLQGRDVQLWKEEICYYLFLTNQFSNQKSLRTHRFFPPPQTIETKKVCFSTFLWKKRKYQQGGFSATGLQAGPGGAPALQGGANTETPAGLASPLPVLISGATLLRVSRSLGMPAGWKRAVWPFAAHWWQTETVHPTEPDWEHLPRQTLPLDACAATACSNLPRPCTPEPPPGAATPLKCPWRCTIWPN